MAWSTPPTFVAAATLPAADLNKVRDDLNFLYSPPKCSLTRSAAKSIANSTTTQFDFDQEDYDNDTMHSNATNPSRSTIKTAGVYLIIGATTWTNNVTGRRLSQFIVNGVTGLTGHDQATVGGAGECSYVISQQRLFAVNDYVELNVFQSSGGALNVNCSLTAHFLSN